MKELKCNKNKIFNKSFIFISFNYVLRIAILFYYTRYSNKLSVKNRRKANQYYFFNSVNNYQICLPGLKTLPLKWQQVS